MARMDDPHSKHGSVLLMWSSRFLTVSNHPGRNGWGLLLFGKVTEGMDVVDQIRR